MIRAGAGDLKVIGRANAVRIEARGVACAAKQELLDAAQITVRREGNVVYVETTLPQDDDDWSWGKNDYAYIDLGIALPSSIAGRCHRLERRRGIRGPEGADAAGQLRRSRRSRASPALVDVGDSSGDFEIDNAGSVRVRDSSGDIDIDDVQRRCRRACSTARATSRSRRSTAA